MAGPRPRRRPVLFLMAAVLVTVVVLIVQGAASSRPNASESVQAYLDQLRPGVQTSITDGADFSDIRDNAAKLGRNGVDRRVTRLANSVQTTLTDIDTLTPPASMRVAQAYLVAALGVRAKAVAEARGALDGALTETSAPGQGAQDAVSALGIVGQDLELGDRAFGLFIGSVPKGVQGLPPSSWVSDPTVWTTVELTAYVTQLRSSATLTPVHDMAMVAYETNPGPVAVQDGVEIIPLAADMTVSMVIENVGNQSEHNVTVTALLTLANGTQQSLRDFIDLSPGQRRAITLASMHPPVGAQGTLSVTVQPVFGETNLANNTLAAQVAFR